MGKIIRAWLLMQTIDGAYPLPTSETSYLANSDLIDTVLPTNAGTLQADGTWWQDPLRTDHAWARGLRALANAAGQRYVPVLNPGHGTDYANLKAVLDDPSLWAVSANDAINLAETRFDAPWDGMLYDAVSIELAYLSKHEDFMEYLSSQVRAAGFQFEMAFHGILPAHEPWAPSLDMFARSADMMDLYIFDWWLTPYTIGPYWWAVESIENALAHDFDSSKLNVGVALFQRYWPNSGVSLNNTLVYEQALQMIRDASSQVEWIESYDTGLIKEHRATVGAGHICLSTGPTIEPRLELADDYNLHGAMIFAPGLGQESGWFAIEDWKYPWPRGEFRLQNPDNKDPRTRESRDKYAVWLDD